MHNRLDLRRRDRQTCLQPVAVMWCDSNGPDKFANVAALDVSEYGLGLQTPEPLPDRARVVLRAPRLGLHGEALVRHCSRRGTQYLVGLEFGRNMRWRPVSEPGS